MHVAPADFRTVRSGQLVLRFALLRDVAYVLADVPAGAAAIVLEEGCEREHWAFVVDGRLTIEIGDRPQVVAAGMAFHVAAGAEHRMVAGPSARLAGFAPIEPERDLSDAGLKAAGLEVLSRPPRLQEALPSVAPPDGRLPEAGAVVAASHRMGDQVFTRAVLGARSGYTTSWCDVPHWGLVTAGALAIEWEEDIEVLSAGDVYYCPAGPPGHRLQAADGATLIDFTPAGAVSVAGRIAAWRREAIREALSNDSADNGEELATAPLR